MPVIKAFEVFDPQKLSSDGHGDGEKVHGNDFISQLCNHYGIDECTAQQEWESLRILLQEQEFKDKSATQVMKSLSSNQTLVALYPTISRFAQIALTLPISNADVERGFSCMNRVKTDLRNRLTVSSLDTLLRISIEGPEKDFDFSAAVSRWSGLRNRRIF